MLSRTIFRSRRIIRMYRGQELEFFDFSGGMASNKPATLIERNQAKLLRNINVTPGGGIEKRQGDTVFNSSALTGAGAVTGLGYYKNLSASEWLLAISGSAIYQSSSLSGTFTDITGAVTITSSANNMWTFSQMNDLAIFVGGAPNPPIKYSGAGNAAALGGSPVSGAFGFQQNNRFFIGSTAANPSRLYYSVLSNPEDWSGTGSGSLDIYTNDGDILVGAATLTTDNVLLFKQNSIHLMPVRTAPFPVFPIFRGVGAVGKKAIVEADGLVYFITPQARMKVTDGSRIFTEQDLPHLRDIDDIWDGLNQSRLQYIQGIRYTGLGFDHIVWVCSNTSSSTNNLAIVWDLNNKCWLQHTTGYKASVLAKTQSGVLYAGHYNGKVYKKDVASTYSDSSETSPGAIDALWRSGWGIQNSLQTSIHPARLNIAMLGQSSGSLTVGYGFDFSTDQSITAVDMQAPGGLWDQMLWDQGKWGGQSDIVRHVFLKGRGTAFQVSFSNMTAGQYFKVHGFTVSGKKSAQKVFTVS